MLLPQSNIIAAFVLSHSNLFCDVSSVFPTYSKHNITQFTTTIVVVLIVTVVVVVVVVVVVLAVVVVVVVVVIVVVEVLDLCCCCCCYSKRILIFFCRYEVNLEDLIELTFSLQY